MTDDGICGSTDTSSGEPCQRPAGWGTDHDSGHCRTHRDDDAEQQSRGPGRPTKLTRQRQENIAQMLENGQSVQAACRCNDIHVSTFYEWLDRGDDQEEGIFREFSERVARARGAGEAKLVDELIETCREKGDTRTMLSIIRSRYPESWGDAEETDDGGSVNIHLSPQKQSTPEDN